MLLKYLFFLVFASHSLSSPTYELSWDPLFSSCPFYTTEDFGLDATVQILKRQLETKNEAAESCLPLHQTLIQNFSSLQALQKRDPAQAEKIQKDFMQRKLVDLQADAALLQLAPGSDPSSSELKKQEINQLIQGLENIQLEESLKTQNYQETTENQVREELYRNSKSILSALQASDPRCIDQIGGWRQILPIVLSLSASATGFGAFANQAIIGPILDLAAGITSILKNKSARSALKSLIETKNHQILACTYYSLKKASCEYHRAYKLSQETDRIKSLLKGYISDPSTRDYEIYFKFLDTRSIFDPIFEATANLGSIYTFNIDQLRTYFESRLSLDALPPLPKGIAISDLDKNRWLYQISNLGIGAPERDFSGKPLSLDERITFTINEITLRKNNLELIEAKIAETRSFIDLKHELETQSQSPKLSLPPLIQYFKKFLQDFRTKKDFQDLAIDVEGPILAALKILEPLNDFLKISPKDLVNFDDYDQTVNRAGLTLFQEMARGAVAQINQQTVLSLPIKSKERLMRAFKAISEAYTLRDARFVENNSDHKTYSDFKAKRALLFQTLQNYKQFSGPGTTFRLGNIQSNLSSFEKGFSDEIELMMKKALKESSDEMPELVGKTGAHLCALFAQYFDQNYWLKWKYLKKCKEKYHSLELLGYFGPSSEAIEYDNHCFYVQYMNTLETQRTLFESYQRSQDILKQSEFTQ